MHGLSRMTIDPRIGGGYLSTQLFFAGMEDSRHDGTVAVLTVVGAPSGAHVNLSADEHHYCAGFLMHAVEGIKPYHGP